MPLRQVSQVSPLPLPHLSVTADSLYAVLCRWPSLREPPLRFLLFRLVPCSDATLEQLETGPNLEAHIVSSPREASREVGYSLLRAAYKESLRKLEALAAIQSSALQSSALAPSTDGECLLLNDGQAPLLLFLHV